MTTLLTVIAALVIAALVVTALIMVVRFEMFCLHDLAETADGDLQHLTRRGWFGLIVAVIPLGGIVYLYRGKAPGGTWPSG